jgi:hypothetical protein
MLQSNKLRSEKALGRYKILKGHDKAEHGKVIENKKKNHTGYNEQMEEPGLTPGIVYRLKCLCFHNIPFLKQLCRK